MDLFEAQGLPAACVDWDADAWLAQFARSDAAGERQSCYILDFSNPPRVRADSTGFADSEARLALVAVCPCTECYRPTTALFYRWNHETADEEEPIVEARMEQLNWHSLHPQRKKKA